MTEEPASREIYRYRTKALTGPWQPTIGAAIDDAIRARQMRADADGQIHWITPGAIERSYTGNDESMGPDEGQIG